jgi:hypothetical protein
MTRPTSVAPRARAVAAALALPALLLATAALAQPPAACPPADPRAIPQSTVTARLPDGHQGRPYPPAPITSGGTAPYAACSDPPLPPGLALRPSGELAGTPRTAGVFRFVLSLSDASTPPQLTRQTFSLRILPAHPKPAPPPRAHPAIHLTAAPQPRLPGSSSSRSASLPPCRPRARPTMCAAPGARRSGRTSGSAAAAERT